MKKSRIKYLYLLFVSVLLYNCTKPIDFNQVKDLVLQPVVESSLIFYTASAGDFFVGGNELNTTSDFVKIDLFNNSFIQEDLVKIEFVFEIENSINRAYQLHLSFLDQSGNALESFNINTEASPNNEIIPSTHIESFEGVALEKIKQSKILAFTLIMLPGEAINQNTLGEISVKSKGVFFLNID